MRPLIVAILGLSLAAAPAEGAQIVLKDGHTLNGAVAVDGVGLKVTGADGKVQLVPFAAVQGISLDEQPLFAQPHGVEESKFFNNDWLVWTAIGANVATMVLGGVMLYRAATRPAAAN